MKNNFTKSILICLMMTSIFACQKDTQPSVTSEAGKKTALDALTLTQANKTGTSIQVTLTAGASGAPAGFSLHWMSKTDFIKYGWAKADSAASFCSAGFSGVPGCSGFNMGSNKAVTVSIGDNLFDDCGVSSSCADQALKCGTEYVFRAFAHNDPRSGLGKSIWSNDLTASTLDCETTACTFGQGYWKNHSISPTGNNTNVWPVNSLTLGNKAYTDLELVTIFRAPVAGNGLISLSHQLIAAKLNIANGIAGGSEVTAAIASADALIGSLVVPPVGTGNLKPGAVSALITALETFNRSTGCEE